MVVAVLDVETTGIPDDLVPDNAPPERRGIPDPRIIEVGACIYQLIDGKWELIDLFDSLARPEGVDWRQKVAHTTRWHSLSSLHLEAAPLDIDVGRVLEDWLENYRPICLLSYRAQFDFHAQLLGAPVWLGRLMHRVPAGPCLMEATIKELGLGRETLSLQAAREAFLLNPLPYPHHALCDARGTGDLLNHLNIDLEAFTGQREWRGDAIFPPLSRWDTPWGDEQRRASKGGPNG